MVNANDENKTLQSKDDGDEKVKEQNQQDCDQKQNVLLSAIKERFSENLEESKHSIIFLSVLQENGMEVSVGQICDNLLSDIIRSLGS